MNLRAMFGLNYNISEQLTILSCVAMRLMKIIEHFRIVPHGHIGGIPIIVMNAEVAHLHGVNVQFENGGILAAFVETMDGLLIGEVSFESPNGGTIYWKGMDNKQFMKELIACTLTY